MFACVDVDYREEEAAAACVVFEGWTDPEPRLEVVEWCKKIEEYIPGEFYRRELPCLLAVLARLPHTPKTVVIDGYVWLGDESKPGLGGLLHAKLAVPVIGIAKNHFVGAGPVEQVLRGASKKPLYVSSAGLGLPEAAEIVQRMAGEHRLPTLVKLADQLCRTAKSSSSALPNVDG